MSSTRKWVKQAKRVISAHLARPRRGTADAQIRPGETFIHESIIDTRFIGTIDAVAKLGPYEAIVPSVSGQAWITFLSQVGLDPSDPIRRGYTLSDTWLEAIG